MLLLRWKGGKIPTQPISIFSTGRLDERKEFSTHLMSWEGITDAFDIVNIFYAQVRGKKSINKHKCVCVCESVYVNRSTCSAQIVIDNIFRRMGGSWAVGVTVANLGVCLKRPPCK